MKPCPFCGGNAEFGQLHYLHSSCDPYYIICTQCGMMTATSHESKSIQAKQWNKRVNNNTYPRTTNKTQKEQPQTTKNLKQIRQSRGLTQSQLAEKSGVNVRMIQYYEQGYKDINTAEVMTVYKLATALNCTVENLIETKKEVED